MRITAVLPGLLLAACASTPRPYAPVENVRYSAVGETPFWMLAIGDDRIVLRVAGADGDAVWPRTLPRTQGGVTTWQSGDGTGVITVEARHAPCTNAAGRRFEDNVVVRLSGRELRGCGGRLLGERE